MCILECAFNAQLGCLQLYTYLCFCLCKTLGLARDESRQSSQVITEHVHNLGIYTVPGMHMTF